MAALRGFLVEELCPEQGTAANAQRFEPLRVLAKISSQIFRVEAPAWQGAKVQEYQAYSELSQRRQARCIGAKNVKLFLREP